jgi:hypothetical protein
MAAISMVFTIARVAEILGEDEAWLWELSNRMEPEDGAIWVVGTAEHETQAFTEYGIQVLRDLIAEQRRARTAPPPPPKTSP